MSSTYNVSRSDAADMLDVSTRTIDRYIKKGKLSYKKTSNRVFLSEKELKKHKQDDGKVQQNAHSEVINDSGQSEQASWNVDNSSIARIEEQLNENIQTMLETIKEKDEKLEQKNQTIFELQNQVGKLEAKLEKTIALPEHKEQKKELYQEKEKLKLEKKELYEKIEKQKIKNAIYLALFVLGAIVLVGLAI